MKNEKPFNLKKIKDELDVLWSLAIRTRDGFYCRRCGTGGARTRGIQAAHIFSRSNLATRWDLENGLTLCNACHRWWAHTHPIEFSLWVREVLGAKRFKALEKKARSTYPASNLRLDYPKIKRSLEEMGL